MAPITLEPQTLSTPQARSTYDRWNSTTGQPDASGYVPLSEFDLAVNAKLDQIANLEQNWDAQGACSVYPSIIEAARELISSLPARIKAHASSIPAVVPMRKGNLQFEWHEGPKTLELEIESPSTIHYLKFHPNAGIEKEDLCAITDTDTVAGLIQWFVGA